IDGRLLRRRLESGAFTILQATPATWRILLDAGWTGNPDLKALIGGEALPPELVAPLLERTAELWNVYGPTETTIWSSVQRVTAADEITVGRPIANTSFLVVDARLQPVPIGVAGELLIGGDGLARGYHRRPELTAERFVTIAVPGAASPQRMYRTGDLARFRRDGQVVHLGRLDHQVKIRGFRIELGEIEAVLATHEAIQQAVVVARDAGTPAARLVAYYVPAAEPLPTAELRRHLRASLPEYMVPQQYVALSQFPLTPNGKIDRRRLPDPGVPDEAASDVLAPRTPAEARVAAAFCDVLGLTSVGVDADFFDLGGQSILGLQLVSRLEEEFGVEVPLQVLFEASTVADLAARVSATSADASRPARSDRAEIARKLEKAWAAALGAAPGDPHDRAAGAALADADVTRLLAEVRRSFGVAAEGISAVEFRKDPSIAGLARLVEDAMEPPPRLLVPLQRRGSGRPLFLIHAGGGYVFFYRALAAHLGDQRPVYGIRAATRHDGELHRLDRATSIEELAARYIDEIKTVQPEGPYHLGGACFGGVVAFEMARQLRARGESLASPLLLFDSYATAPPGNEEWRGYRHWALSRAAEKLGAGTDLAEADGAVWLILRSAIRRPGTLARFPLLAVRAVLRRLMRRVRDNGWTRRLRERRRRSMTREQQQLETMAELLEASLRLLGRYRPVPAPEAAVLFKAEKSPDPEPDWLPLLRGGVETHVRPGEHLDMMEEPWVAETAALVAASLEAGGAVSPAGGTGA
ncbi:MAG TPA: thioesterase domain-containing protein, partial [Myxococcota bacterium]